MVVDKSLETPFCWVYPSPVPLTLPQANSYVDLHGFGYFWAVGGAFETLEGGKLAPGEARKGPR